MSWAEVKHALNSTLGENGFSSLDKMIKGGVKRFTENGTFTVPNGVYKILITACAGGQRGDYKPNPPARGGQGGEWVFKSPYIVSPGDSISITVGEGGTNSSSLGGNTIIGSLLTLLGGGVSGNITGGYPSYVEVDQEFNFNIGYAAGGGFSRGGKFYMQKYSGDSYRMCGGGGGSLGPGANGESNTSAGFGGGGGGTTESSYACMNGGNGIVIIEW